jgi:hypothetical protein
MIRAGSLPLTMTWSGAVSGQAPGAATPPRDSAGWGPCHEDHAPRRASRFLQLRWAELAHPTHPSRETRARHEVRQRGSARDVHAARALARPERGDELRLRPVSPPHPGGAAGWPHRQPGARCRRPSVSHRASWRGRRHRMHVRRGPSDGPRARGERPRRGRLDENPGGAPPNLVTWFVKCLPRVVNRLPYLVKRLLHPPASPRCRRGERRPLQRRSACV